jgi:hypothetical protein
MKLTTMSTEEPNGYSNIWLTLKNESLNRGPFPGSHEELQHINIQIGLVREKCVPHEFEFRCLAYSVFQYSAVTGP